MEKTLRIRPMRHEDLLPIVALHKKTMMSPGSVLGPAYLAPFYQTLLDHPLVNRLFIAEKEGRIVGFITATADLAQTNAYFPLPFFVRLIPRILFLWVTGKIDPIRLIRHRTLTRKALKLESPYPTILTLAVAHDFQRRGIGSLLLNAVCLEIPKLGFQSLYVDTHHTNVAAIKFYRRNGFIPCLSFTDNLILLRTFSKK